MTRESKIEHKVDDWARDQRILALKMTPRGLRGYPDKFYFYNGIVAIIEFKAPGQRPEPLQEVRIKQLRDLGFNVLVCDDVEEGCDFLWKVLVCQVTGSPVHSKRPV